MTIKVFSVAEMAAAERAADAAGNRYEQMMENAGKAAAEAIVSRYPVVDTKITVLVGPGNNGGDGLVAGRYLAEAGAEVSFYMYKSRSPEEDRNLTLVQEMGLLVLTAEFDQQYRVLRNRLNITEILIDSLLGTGAARPIKGELAKLMGYVQSAIRKREASKFTDRNRALLSVAEIGNGEELDDNGKIAAIGSGSQRMIVAAVDCPSGLNCDTGHLDPLSIQADLTITFAGPKRGHFKFPGAAACGELVVADIGIGPELKEVSEVDSELITQERVRQLLPTRSIDGHKGTFGWVMIAAGSARYWGAPALAGKAAYRMGSGLTALAVPSVVRPAAAVLLPEATYPLIEETSILTAKAANHITEQLPSYQALLVGPGVHDASEFMEHLLANFSEEPDKAPPMVIDADGLNLLAKMNDWPKLLPANTILTPHLGEAARLMGVNLVDLKEKDRFKLVVEWAAKWDCVLLLKGAYTLVGEPSGKIAVIPFANPALATAGSGDVLSGIIVSLLGQGLKPFEAAAAGAFVHGAAAEMAGVSSGILAGELADWIPDVVHQLRILKP